MCVHDLPQAKDSQPGVPVRLDPKLRRRERVKISSGETMAEEKPSLHIDTDWKKQAQEEKRRLAEEEQKRAAERAAAASAAPPIGNVTGATAPPSGGAASAGPSPARG